MKKYFVILNPVSGTVDVKNVVLLLNTYLKDHYFLYTTTGHEDLRSVVLDALKHKYEMIVAIGGDGTVSDSAESLLKSGVPLAIVPTGTANNLALELGIPTTLEGAIALIVNKNKTIAIDAMKVGDRYYFLDISIGAKSLAIRDTRREAKLRFGVFAYIIKGIQWMVSFQPKKFTIIADQKESTYKASSVVIANAGILGIPAFRYTKDMRIDDGVLNVCIIRANSLLEYVRVGYRFLRNSKTAQDSVHYLTAAKEVIIRTKTHLPVQADGEIIGEGEVAVMLVPRSLRVVVPR